MYCSNSKFKKDISSAPWHLNMFLNGNLKDKMIFIPIIIMMIGFVVWAKILTLLLIYFFAYLLFGPVLLCFWVLSR